MAMTQEEIQLEKDKLCYEQNWLQARSINDKLHKIPIMSIWITGGLWFGSTFAVDALSMFRPFILLFAGLCNILLILAAYKIRDVFQSYLDKIKEFNPNSFVRGRPLNPRVRSYGKYGMLKMFSILMFTAFYISVATGIYELVNTSCDPLCKLFAVFGVPLLLIAIIYAIFLNQSPNQGTETTE